MHRYHRENPYDGFDAGQLAYGPRRMEQHRSGARRANSQDKTYSDSRGLTGQLRRTALLASANSATRACAYIVPNDPEHVSAVVTTPSTRSVSAALTGSAGHPGLGGPSCLSAGAEDEPAGLAPCPVRALRVRRGR